MKKNLFRKALCFILSAAILLGAVSVTALAGSLKGEESTAATLEEMQALVGTLPYADYIKMYSDKVNRPGLAPISIDIKNFDGNAYLVADSVACNGSMSSNPDAWKEFGDENLTESVYLPSTGSVTWDLEVGKGDVGLYFIKFEYYSCITPESSVSAIERGFLIDGLIPFSEVAGITLDKNWSFDYVSEAEPESVPGAPNSYITP